jgi:hypothetical protein
MNKRVAFGTIVIAHFLIPSSYFVVGAMAQGARIVSKEPPPLFVELEQPPENKKLALEALTEIGVNSGAIANANDSEILYTSEKRPTHRHSQAYSMNLITKKEQRLTYQDGEVQGILSINSNRKLIYSSTTDEIKENPQIIREYFEKELVKKEESSPWKFNPFELYIMDRTGSNIERLTTNRGFDAEAALSPDQETLYYASLERGELQLKSLSLKQRQSQTLAKKKGYHLTQPTPTTDGRRLAWVELSKNGDQSQIVLGDLKGKPIEVLTTAKAIHWAPAWHPSDPVMIFSSNRFGEGSFEILTLDLATKCLKRWTYHSASDTLPSFSQDGSAILFTSDRTGSKQIYQLPYDKAIPCLEIIP